MTALFKIALETMLTWYYHPFLFTFKLTRLPSGYPAGWDFPEGTTPNRAEYHDRGWCFTEHSVSVLFKDSDMVLDLARADGFSPPSYSRATQFALHCASGVHTSTKGSRVNTRIWHETCM